MTTLANRWKGLSATQQDTLIAVGMTLLGWAQAVTVWAVFGPPRHVGGRGGAPIPDAVSRGFADVGGGPVPAPTPLVFILLALIFMPLAFRRKWPIQVALYTGAIVAIYESLRMPPVMTALAAMLAVYTVGTLYARKATVLTGIAVTVMLLIGGRPQVFELNGRWIADMIGTIGLMTASAAFGDATRNRRDYVAEVEQRAAEAERTRDEEARRRVDEERLRIARELHDVTAHSLSIIAVQSGAAERVVDSDPEAARRALASIRGTAKSSLDELRSMLGVLRQADDGTPLAPAPELGQVEELVRAVRNAGVEVTLVTDYLDPVPSVTQASAYRIVQEALTNVVRHARARTATVTLIAKEDRLTLDVVDDGIGGAVNGGGHGIAGMRERVTALGGTFTAGPAPGAGFVVHAEFPLPRRQ